MRKLGDIITDLEKLVTEMVDGHDMQWGDILAIVWNYLRVHRPEARENYVEGGYPEYYYGPKEER